MNNTILIAVFQEHCDKCWYRDILKLIKDEKSCKFCYQVNRDISILLSRIEGARRSIDIGIALPNSSKLNEYIPYEKAGFILFTHTGNDLNKRVLAILDKAFELNYENVILISHSTPDLPPLYIKEAIEKLHRGKKLVFGPLSNGGLYLVGMNKSFYFNNRKKNIFRIINFKTRKLAIIISMFLRKQYLSYFFLPKWHQLRRMPDFKRLSHKSYRENIAWSATWTRQIINKYIGLK